MIPWFEIPKLWIPTGPLQGVIYGITGKSMEYLEIHGFGILVALGFYFGSRSAMNRAKALGLDPEVINRLVGWLIMGTFVGGHVGYGLMYHPQEYLANPRLFLEFWQGLSSFGGFAVCVPLSIWFFAKEKVPVWPYLDCLAYGMGIGWFFGRMGCFVAHDHPGAVSEFFLAVQGICRTPGICEGPNCMVACHDMGLYEAMWSLAVFLLFIGIDKSRALIPGVMTISLGLMYGPVRFAMDALRPETTDVRYLGLTPGQYWSLALTLVCIGLITMRMKSKDAPIQPGVTLVGGTGVVADSEE